MGYIVQGRLRVGHPNILDLEPALLTMPYTYSNFLLTFDNETITKKKSSTYSETPI